MSERGRLTWGETVGETKKVESVPELDALLDELQTQAAAGQPLIVRLSIPDGGILAMGLGLGLTVLNHTPASLDPPYLHSVGPTQEGDDLVFYYDGHWTDFSHAYAISLNEGREAMRHFLREGTLSPSVRWKRPKNRRRVSSSSLELTHFSHSNALVIDVTRCPHSEPDRVLAGSPSREVQHRAERGTMSRGISARCPGTSQSAPTSQVTAYCWAPPQLLYSPPQTQASPRGLSEKRSHSGIVSR